MMNLCDWLDHFIKVFQGPVVQSIVSLTKSLVNDSLSLLVRLKSSVLIFFAEKNGSVFMYNMFEILTSR